MRAVCSVASAKPAAMAASPASRWKATARLRAAKARASEQHGQPRGRYRRRLARGAEIKADADGEGDRQPEEAASLADLPRQIEREPGAELAQARQARSEHRPASGRAAAIARDRAPCCRPCSSTIPLPPTGSPNSRLTLGLSGRPPDFACLATYATRSAPAHQPIAGLFAYPMCRNRRSET